MEITDCKWSIDSYKLVKEEISEVIKTSEISLQLERYCSRIFTMVKMVAIATVSPVSS